MLEENGITFSYSDENEQVQDESPIVTTYYDTLPRVYFGVEEEEKLNNGLKKAKDRTGVGSKYTQ